MSTGGSASADAPVQPVVADQGPVPEGVARSTVTTTVCVPTALANDFVLQAPYQPEARRTSPLQEPVIVAGRFAHTPLSTFHALRRLSALPMQRCLSRRGLSTSEVARPCLLSAAEAYESFPAATRYAVWLCVRPTFFDKHLWLGPTTPPTARSLTTHDTPVGHFIDQWTFSAPLHTSTGMTEYNQPLYHNLPPATSVLAAVTRHGATLRPASTCGLATTSWPTTCQSR